MSPVEQTEVQQPEVAVQASEAVQAPPPASNMAKNLIALVIVVILLAGLGTYVYKKYQYYNPVPMTEGMPGVGEGSK